MFNFFIGIFVPGVSAGSSSDERFFFSIGFAIARDVVSNKTPIKKLT